MFQQTRNFSRKGLSDVSMHYYSMIMRIFKVFIYFFVFALSEEMLDTHTRNQASRRQRVHRARKC